MPAIFLYTFHSTIFGFFVSVGDVTYVNFCFFLCIPYWKMCARFENNVRGFSGSLKRAQVKDYASEAISMAFSCPNEKSMIKERHEHQSTRKWDHGWKELNGKWLGGRELTLRFSEGPFTSHMIFVFYFILLWNIHSTSTCTDHLI